MLLRQLLSRYLFLAALVVVAAACGKSETDSGEGPVQWKFAIEEIAGSVQDAYAQQFKRLIKERSGGRISVTVYPYGTLGTSAQLTELVQSGSIQFAMASPGHLGSVVPESQLLLLHFVFSDDPAINHRVLATSTPLHDRLGEAYRRRGLHFLGAFTEGWMVWTANKPIRTPADLQGVKIRTMVSPLLLEQYQLYGANPTPMAYSEVYSGLQLNMIDAQVNPVFAIEEMGFHEVQSYMILAAHLPFISTLVANPSFYDGLDEGDRKLVRSVAAEVDEHVFEVQQRLNRERLATIREESDIEIIELSDAERAAFLEASLPIREKYIELAGEGGQALLETLLAEIERAESATTP